MTQARSQQSSLAVLLEFSVCVGCFFILIKLQAYICSYFHYFYHKLSALSGQKFGNPINMVSMGMKLRFLYPSVTRVKINNRAFYTNVSVREGIKLETKERYSVFLSHIENSFCAWPSWGKCSLVVQICKSHTVNNHEGSI